MSRYKKGLGKLGENIATSYLKQSGYQVLQRNYRCRLGEVDIIAMDKDTLVFIEVRSCSARRFGLPQESITWRKQTKLKIVAQYYLKATGNIRLPVRFDVLALLFDKDYFLKKIDHIKNAF